MQNVDRHGLHQGPQQVAVPLFSSDSSIQNLEGMGQWGVSPLPAQSSTLSLREALGSYDPQRVSSRTISGAVVESPLKSIIPPHFGARGYSQDPKPYQHVDLFAPQKRENIDQTTLFHRLSLSTAPETS